MLFDTPPYSAARERRSMAALLSLLVAACGGEATGSGKGEGDDASTRGARADAGTDGSDDASLNFPSDGAFGGPDANLVFDAGERVLSIAPSDPVIDSNGSEQTLELTAMLDGLPLDSANWSVSGASALGSVDESGMFRTDGRTAGTVSVTARYGNLTATAELRIRVNWEDVQDGVTDAQRAGLEADPSDDPSFEWLYPYEATVFPRGLPAPFMQLGGGDADALRVSITVGDFSYEGFFPASAPASLTLPQEVWDAMTLSADGSEPVNVEVTKLVGDEAIGPVQRSFRIAPADLKGTIYYNTYDSVAVGTGAVMRIRPGEDAEVLLGGCTVCHSVSAEGNALSAGVNWGDGNPLTSSTFDLLDDGTSPARYSEDDGRVFSFAGLTPDGAMLISNGIPASGPSIRGLAADPDALPSALFDAETNTRIDAPTFTDQVQYAITPAFSPDARRLAFNWQENDDGRTLAVMDADLTAMPPEFSEPQVVATVETSGVNWPNPTTANGVVGWPSFLPDGDGVVYHVGDRFDTVAWGPAPSYAELRLVDVENQTVKELEALNGWRDDDSSYLPHGADEENYRNYEPSVLPLPVGGYYWVLFTSRRGYGHTLAPGGTLAGSDNEWGEMIDGTEHPSPRKKLWLAAIDVNWKDADDPSHPAIYLPGQELEAGNMRAYAALSPCLELGESCESGADCCEGFCRALGDVGEPVCVVPPETCSFTDETCDSDADCCGAPMGETCINNRCAAPTPILH